MVRTKCIRHPADAPLVIIHQWQADLFMGNKTKAALLSVFEYWHGINLAKFETRDPEKLVQRYNQQTLEHFLLGIAKKRSISEAVKELNEEGYITLFKSNTTVQTHKYLFNVEPVQEWVDYWDEVYQDHKNGPFGKHPICIPPNLMESTNTQKRTAKTQKRTANWQNCDTITQKEIHIETIPLETIPLETIHLDKEESFSDTKPVASGLVDPITSSEQDKKGASRGKSQKSKAETNKPTKKKEYTAEELQPFLDVYNNEKPDKWAKAEKLTANRVKNLNLLIDEYGDKSLIMLRRALLAARRDTWWANKDFKLDYLYRPRGSNGNGDNLTGLAEMVSEDELDKPQQHRFNPQNEKLARLMEKNKRALELVSGGFVA